MEMSNGMIEIDFFNLMGIGKWDMGYDYKGERVY